MYLEIISKKLKKQANSLEQTNYGKNNKYKFIIFEIFLKNKVWRVNQIKKTD